MQQSNSRLNYQGLLSAIILAIFMLTILHGCDDNHPAFVKQNSHKIKSS